MSDWDAVRQLAAEFQKLQSSTGAFHLSEGNCVEVVTKLVDMGLLEVLYTVDGKEYITPQHLEREIRNELRANRGRINTVDLQQILNVDLSHIEGKVADILRRDRNIIMLQGELIDRSYMDALYEEVNETLQEVGQVAISDLCKNFSLPNDFLIEHIESAIGGKIKGQLDKNDSGAIYTDAFVARYHARIRGLFNAITRPTAIGPIIARGSYQEKLFLIVVHDLVSSGILAGTLHGHTDKAVYIPHVYTSMQNKWADSFLQSNGYLEFDALRRLGIDDPQRFIAQRYSSRKDVLELVSCVVGDTVMTELGAAVEEALATDGWVELLSLLPPPCIPEDAISLVQKKYSTNPDLKPVGHILIDKTLVQTCFNHFQPLVQEKAQKVATTQTSKVSEMIQKSLEHEELLSQKGSSRKKGGKEKRSKGKREAEPLDNMPKGGGDKWDLQFMGPEQISAVLLEKYPECSEDVVAIITADISSPLQLAFQEEATACLSNLGQSSSASHQKKRHASIQERVYGLWSTAKLFQKAVSLFDGDGATQLSKYLLHTVCSDLINMVILFIAEDYGLEIPQHESLNGKERTKLISGLNDHMRKALSELEKSLAAKSSDQFFNLFEGFCAQDFCGIMLRKLDKKKERQLLFSHQQSLLDNLREELDLAMMLHLITVILFQQHTGCIIHIPGKLVPQVLAFLAPRLDSKDQEKLSECQRLISLHLRSQRSTVVKEIVPCNDTASLSDTNNTCATNEGIHSVSSSKESDFRGQSLTEENVSKEEPVDMQRVIDLLSDLKRMVLTKPSKTASNS